MRMVRRRRTTRHLLVALLVVTFAVLVGMVAAIGLNEQWANTPIADNYENYCANEDIIAPELTLIGEAEVTIVQGTKYTEAGVEVNDYCEVYLGEVAGTVNADQPGEYQLRYQATDARGNTAEVVRKVHVREHGRGVVYLTFDDGPGPYTAELLDVLAKYKVKATFFVTGAGDDALIAREYQEGHTVALHSLTHNYAEIYQNTDAYFADLYAVQERVKRATGQTVTLLRFPGGSSNTVSRNYDNGARIMSQLTAEVERRGFTYYDWNVDSSDTGRARTAEAVFANVAGGLREGGQTVVLQHDVRGFSVAAVERIIQYGLEQGFVFDRLSADSFAAHHGVNN